MIPCSHEIDSKIDTGVYELVTCNKPSTRFFSNDPGHGFPELSESVFGRCSIHSKFGLKFKTNEISREEYETFKVVNS